MKASKHDATAFLLCLYYIMQCNRNPSVILVKCFDRCFGNAIVNSISDLTNYNKLFLAK